MTKSSTVVGATWVTAGAMVANVAAYLLHVPAARVLGTVGYGEFAFLLALQLLLAVPALAMQNVVARQRVRGAHTASLRHLAARTAVTVAVVATLAVPVVVAVRGVSWSAAAAGLVVAPVLVLLAAEQGILQGELRLRRLGFLVAFSGAAKVVPAVAAIYAGSGVSGALVAGAAGSAIAYGVGRAVAGPSVGPIDAGAGDARAVLWASQVQLALIAFTSADLLLTGVILDESASGLYAHGAVATKAAFWMPTAVGVVLYPRMADPVKSREASRSALAVLAGLGAVAVVGAAAVGPLVPVLVGDAYRPVAGILWAFALLGGLAALLQGALLSVIASGRRSMVWPVWLGLAAEVALVLAVPRSVTGVLVVAIPCVAVSAGILVGRVLRGSPPYVNA